MVNEPMKNHTSLKMGGPADYLIIPQNQEELVKLLLFSRKEFIPFFIFGAGTNLLVSDKGIRGLAVKMDKSFRTLSFERSQIRAGAGLPLPMLSAKAARAGLSGMEFAAGIPGTTGAAAVINAGAYGNSMSDIITSIKVLTWQGEIRTINSREMQFGYRYSSLLEESWIVLEVQLALVEGDYSNIKSRMEEFLEHRRLNHPVEPSAGSVFRNPPGNSAGKLIEEAGCKGLRVGDAQVSNRHANFIINLGTASCIDYLEVIKIIREKVKSKFGILLELELSLVGEES
ncbi:MAG: UDP-N-acetylmuramate dehydrogenase [Candidatus Syntrophonatronum acetioxidans]|uniref:UDP-N-acetylenolpyruvoylglucosamine reductase n=1 Tax=Candidatus Syntrophonatronum acetioxidans TaxID=1795816 RepID=A0A424YBL0_9FIRM|nr:MAG: UDP-N-acetylmuramate dehydrogenase [Candidatus Syntrophonatronum acetioxidans]